MRNLLQLQKKSEPCAHSDTVTGSSAGIKRVVCKACGHVSVFHAGEGVTKGLESGFAVSR